MFNHIITVVQIGLVLFGLYKTYSYGSKVYAAWKSKTSTVSFLLSQLTSFSAYYTVYALLATLAAAFGTRHLHIAYLFLAGAAVVFLLMLHGIALGFLKDHWISEALSKAKTEVDTVAKDVEQGIVNDIKNAL